MVPLAVGRGTWPHRRPQWPRSCSAQPGTARQVVEHHGDHRDLPKPWIPMVFDGFCIIYSIGMYILGYSKAMDSYGFAWIMLDQTLSFNHHRSGSKKKVPSHGDPQLSEKRQTNCFRSSKASHPVEGLCEKYMNIL